MMQYQFRTKHALIAIAVIALTLGALRVAHQSMFAAIVCLFLILPILLTVGIWAGEFVHLATRKKLEEIFAIDANTDRQLRVSVTFVSSCIGLFVGLAVWILGSIGCVILVAFFENR